ncbi:MAG: aldolase [Hespellia sp.]|jgi:L-fuculose-phosphate aldolase|nr:aldolase [Hespellia sp.]
MNETYSFMDVRKQMAKTAKMIWERKLTNAAGGNFAVRVEPGKILSTPSMMSEQKYCELKPEDMLLIDYRYHILEGEGKLSRETHMHVALLSTYPEIGATIHAHPLYCMPFVAFGKTIHSVTDATEGRGDVECMDYAKPCSEQSVKNVMKYFKEREEIVRNKPIGCIMPKHGVVVSGKDLYKAFSMLERIEYEAFCNITRTFI